MVTARLPLKQTYLDILALSAWGILFIYYWLSDQLKLLIHPRYVGVVVVAGLILLGLAVSHAIAAARPRIGPSEHITALPKSFSSGLMLAIAVAAMIVPIQPLGSQAALQEGFTLAGLPTRTQAQRFTGGSRSEERTLSEWARTLAVYPEPDSYEGNLVNVSGFVVHTPDLPDNMFMITRFVIRHCAIDAVPVGLPVQLEGSRDDYPQDQWLQIEGQMASVELNGARRVAIAPESLTEIPKPDDPYEY